MSIKRVLCLARVRRIPTQFSWIDQRLVRDNFIGLCRAEALALYLFLVTVADAQGLSYYSDHSIVCRLPFLAKDRLAQARTELQRVGWIAFEQPLYQVLALETPEQPGGPGQPSPKPPAPHPTGQPVAILEVLRRALEGRHD